MAQPKKQEVLYRPPAETDVVSLIESAKEAFYDDPNVIGVGFGPRRKKGETHTDETGLIVYVKEKLGKGDIKSEHLIPAAFEGVGTDVVEPFGRDAPLEALGFSESHQNSDDMGFVDWERLHEQWTAEAGGEIAFHGKVQIHGDVCVIEDDGTIKVAAVDQAAGERAVDWIKGIVAEPEVGVIYTGKVVKVVDFGAFVNFMGSRDGLVHISELNDGRPHTVTEVVNEGDEVKVKVLGIDDRGKVRLSMRVVDQATGDDITERVGESRPSGGGGRGDRGPRRKREGE